MPVRLVEEDGLEDVAVVRHGCFAAVLVHAELMLIVRAVKGHLDFLWILSVRVGVVHGSITTWFAVWTRGILFCKADLVFLRSGLGMSGKVWIELRLVYFPEVIDVGVGHRNIIVESCASKDELLPPACSLAKQSLGVVRQDSKDHFVECLCGCSGSCMFARSVLQVGIERSCPKHYTSLTSFHNSRNIGGESDVHPFRT